jgi:hypothetical protein
MADSDVPELLAADPLLGPLYRYWDRCRGERRMPDRRDIDPLALGAKLLPHIGLMDIVDGGARVRCRLLGTALVERWGNDPTGKFMDEVASGSYLDFVHSLYRDVVRARAPVFSESVFRWDAQGFLRTRRLYLPLTHGGKDVAMALIGQVFLGPAMQPVTPYTAIVGGPPVEQTTVILEPPTAAPER